MASLSINEKKVLFVFLLILVIALKIYGLLAKKIAWPLIIVLGFLAVITDPTPTAAAE